MQFLKIFAVMAFAMSCSNTGTKTVARNPSVTTDATDEIAPQAPELAGMLKQGGKLFENKGVNVLIHGPMDESGKAYRMVIYSDQTINGKQYAVFSMEQTFNSENIEKYHAILRDEENSHMCSMEITQTNTTCSIDWKPDQSAGCTVYRWGFNEGTTTFEKVN